MFLASRTLILPDSALGFALAFSLGWSLGFSLFSLGGSSPSDGPGSAATARTSAAIAPIVAARRRDWACLPERPAPHRRAASPSVAFSLPAEWNLPTRHSMWPSPDRGAT